MEMTGLADLQVAPTWIGDMIKVPTWRSLIYELSEEHKNCLLLNFAIKVSHVRSA